MTVGQIDTLDAPERIRKGMGQYPVPIVILARLAVSQQDQGRGIGFGLLQDAIRRTMLIAEQAGIRAMLTHPIDDEERSFTASSASSPPHCAASNCCCSSRMPAGGSAESWVHILACARSWRQGTRRPAHAHEPQTQSDPTAQSPMNRPARWHHRSQPQISQLPRQRVPAHPQLRPPSSLRTPLTHKQLRTRWVSFA